MHFIGELILQAVFELLAWSLHGAWQERRDRGRQRLRARSAARRTRRYE